MKKKILIILGVILLIGAGIGGYYWYSVNKEKQYIEAASRFKWDCYVVNGLAGSLAQDITGNCACVLSYQKAFNPKAKNGTKVFMGRMDKCKDITIAVEWRTSSFKDEGYDDIMKKYLADMDSCLLIMNNCPSKYENIQAYFMKAKEDALKLSKEAISPTGSFMFYSQNVGQLESDLISSLKQSDLYVKDCQDKAEAKGKEYLSLYEKLAISAITYQQMRSGSTW